MKTIAIISLKNFIIIKSTKKLLPFTNGCICSFHYISPYVLADKMQCVLLYKAECNCVAFLTFIHNTFYLFALVLNNLHCINANARNTDSARLCRSQRSTLRAQLVVFQRFTLKKSN